MTCTGWTQMASERSKSKRNANQGIFSSLCGKSKAHLLWLLLSFWILACPLVRYKQERSQVTPQSILPVQFSSLLLAFGFVTSIMACLMSDDWQKSLYDMSLKFRLNTSWRPDVCKYHHCSYSKNILISLLYFCSLITNPIILDWGYHMLDPTLLPPLHLISTVVITTILNFLAVTKASLKWWKLGERKPWVFLKVAFP